MTQQLAPVPYPVISKDRMRLHGRDAWSHNLQLATLTGSKLASCLGPAGAYKLVTYHLGPELVTKVTKDAVEIINEIGIQYPAVKTLEEAAKIHREDAGDGVSIMIVLVSALLREADQLLGMGVHPVEIVEGYKEATKKCLTILDEVGMNPEGDLDSSLLELIDCGRGLLGEGLRRGISEALTIVDQDGNPDISRVKIRQKIGGTLADSRLVRGIIIKSGKAHPTMPDEVERPKVAVVVNMEIKHMELVDKKQGTIPAKLNVTEPTQLKLFVQEDYHLRASLVEKVKRSGANVLICRSKLEYRISDKLSREGIFAVESVDNRDLEEVAKATGARIVGCVSDISEEDIGTANRLEVDKIRTEDTVNLYCARSATLLLRGSSPELVNELEKTVKNALLVLKHARSNPKQVPGGGAIFVRLALALRSFALSFEGKEQLAIDSFADALEVVPKWLSINFGLDPIDMIMQLRAFHSKGMYDIGVGEHGCENMSEKKVVELVLINKITMRRAFEVAALLLKIDDYFCVRDLPTFHKH